MSDPISINRKSTYKVPIEFPIDGYCVEFVVSGITNLPVVGDTYTLNGFLYTIIFIDATKIVALRELGDLPSNTGQLARYSGSGDALINYSAYLANQSLWIRGASILFTVKNRPEDADDKAVIQTTGSNYSDYSTLIDFNIVNSDKKGGRYFYDARITYSQGFSMVVEAGEFFIDDSITNTISS